MKFQNPLQGFFSFLYIFIIQTFPDQKKGSDVDDHQIDPGGTSSLRWENILYAYKNLHFCLKNKS